MRNILIFLLVVFPSLVSAAAYKCVDPDGLFTYSSSPCSDSSVKSSVLFPAVPVRKITLVKDASGQYVGRGVFNNVPVVYLLDTGASSTAVSGRVAYAAGYATCQRAGYSRTANGVVSICAVNADIEVSGMVVKNHRVHILNNLAVDMLLGMDILQAMKMEQKDGVMILSR